MATSAAYFFGGRQPSDSPRHWAYAMNPKSEANIDKPIAAVIPIGIKSARNIAIQPRIETWLPDTLPDDDRIEFENDYA